MKNLLIIGAAVLALAACSSSPKETMDGAASDAKTAASDAVSSGKDAMNKGADAAKEAVSGQAASSGDMSSSCTLGKDTRVIEVRKTDAGGCELFYNKFNEEKSVASSGFGTQYCEEVKDRIQANLSKAGFACQ